MQSLSSCNITHLNPKRILVINAIKQLPNHNLIVVDENGKSIKAGYKSIKASIVR
jgi:rRNA processing protein Gar1